MHRTLRILLAGVLTILSLSNILRAAPAQENSRLTLRANSGWRFFLGDPEAAQSPSFSDASWRPIDLPHDWSIESAPDAKNASGAGGGFYPGGIGWYRKTFTAPQAWKGKQIAIDFEGVASNATVYLNGEKLGFHPYAYTSFQFDLTPHLKFGAPNLLAVRVDCSELPNSRWYSGAGIYRNVRVTVTDPVHVAHWGVFVTTPEVSAASAKVVVRTRVANDSPGAADVSIETTILDRAGTKVANSQQKLSIAAASEAETKAEIAISNPRLWSPESPVLYRAVSRIMKNGKVLDQVETPFGIRTLSWSAEKGLVLNGKSVKLTGGSVHHDNAFLGAAAFDRAEERKVQLLKAAGHNAVRTAHNPPSPAFLDACDRLGLLVLDEPFDVWKAAKVKFDYGRNFDEWWKQDVTSMLLRDRNHPSVVIWGIGNEIPELTVERGPGMAKSIIDLVHSLDISRPLTLAFPGLTTAPNAAAVFSMLDITGYNYSLERTFAEDHAKIPSRLMLTTESFPAKAFQLWKISRDNPYVLGDLTWTAMDYLGESGIGAWSAVTPEQAQAATKAGEAMGDPALFNKFFEALANGDDPMKAMASSGNASALSALAILFKTFPWHASSCGDMDLTGYRKPQSYYRDILWNGGDRIYTTVRFPDPEGKKIVAIGWGVYPTLPSWTWPGQEGKPLQVEIYSSAESVRLSLNGKAIGEKPAGENQEFKAVFDVPYAPGTLKAEALRAGRVVAMQEISTAAEPVSLKLTADRSEISANGEDLSYISVEAVDDHGRLQFNAGQQVRVSISGPGAIAGLGNGDGQSTAAYQGDTLTLFHGRALVILRASSTPGTIRISATAAGLAAGSINVSSRAANAVAELR